MNKIHSIVGFGVVTLFSGLALAGDGHGKKFHDTNNDGKVSLQEAVDGAKQKFARKDQDKNGALTANEMQGRAQRRFEKADANKDGRVTLPEFEARVRAWFQERDANKDGFLTRDEFGRGKHHDKDRDGKA